MTSSKTIALAAAAVGTVCASALATFGIPAVQAQQAQQAVPPKVAAPGEEKSGKTRVLEAGSKLLQSNAPLQPFDVYLVGFHPMKDRPDMQVEAHHYCHQVNEDFAQCTLFDSNGENAKLNGIEYIISEKLFESLPAEERKFWHPHNGEILSGQLVAPGIPETAEKSLNEGMPADKLPLGPPMLAWSFSRDGEAKPGLVEKRDKQMGISTAQKRKERAELQQLARPQSGVDDLKGKFGRQTQDIPGVVDKKSAQAGAGQSK